MKYYFYIAGAAFLIASCKQKETDSAGLVKNTDLIQQNLKGNVERIEETSYRVDNSGKQSAMDSLINVSEFDRKGYQTRTSGKYSNGTIKQERTIAHYNNGAVKEVVSKTDGKQTFRMEIIIDRNGNYVMAKSYDSAGKINSYYKDLAQNEYGQVLTGNQYTTGNSLKSSFQTTYDGPNYTGNTNKDSAGNVIYSVKAILNKKGDPAELTTTSTKKDGSTSVEKITYRYDQYDNNGNWIQRTTLNEKGIPVKVVKRTIRYFK